MSLLMDIGLYVKYVLCDQGSSNQKLVKLLNVTVDKQYFVQNENKVLSWFDYNCCLHPAQHVDWRSI